MRTDKEIDNAFKPDGITDDIEEWAKKSGLFGENTHNRHLIHYLNCEDYKEGFSVNWKESHNKSS